LDFDQDGWIEIRMGRKAERVTVEISDSGPGLSPEARQQLFTPFFSTKATGRGMGMAAVLGIVRAHRGAIRVDSEPARGTTVTVWLPRGDKRLSEPATPPPEQVDAQRPIVLVVDDNDGVRRTARRALSRRGFEVLEAPNGRVALEVIAEHSNTNCVILDITMPEMDGVETYQELMKIHPEMPVVMTSGYHTYEKIERAGDHPVAFVQKPFDVRTLVDAVRTALALTA
jgi:two-component system cell cycle sensor histidine kinase/response regulator CckA